MTDLSIINPLNPTSAGSFLAEEWVINLFSALPSFLEMILIEHAKVQTRKTISGALDAAAFYISRRREAREDRERDQLIQGDDVSSDRDTAQSLLSYLSHGLSRLEVVILRFLGSYKAELICLTTYLLERRCLQSSACATLSESLYGTKRVKLEQSSSPTMRTRQLKELTFTDKTRVALLAAIIPYLQEQLDQIFENNNSGISVGGSGDEVIWQVHRRSRDEMRLAMFYKLVRSLLQCINLVFRWRFLVESSFFYDFPNFLLGHIVRRVAQSDEVAANETKDDKSTSSTPPASDHDDDSDASVRKSMAYFVTASIIAGWLTQMRADWENYQRQRHLELHSSPNDDASVTRSSNTYSSLAPPPSPPAWSATSTVSPKNCPLCNQIRKHPTASASGYVFCFTCILPYVQRHGKCPVTGMACSESNLRRLFEPRSDDSAQE